MFYIFCLNVRLSLNVVFVIPFITDGGHHHNLLNNVFVGCGTALFPADWGRTKGNLMVGTNWLS